MNAPMKHIQKNIILPFLIAVVSCGPEQDLKKREKTSSKEVITSESEVAQTSSEKPVITEDTSCVALKLVADDDQAGLGKLFEGYNDLFAKYGAQIGAIAPDGGFEKYMQGSDKLKFGSDEFNKKHKDFTEKFKIFSDLMESKGLGSEKDFKNLEEKILKDDKCIEKDDASDDASKEDDKTENDEE